MNLLRSARFPFSWFDRNANRTRLNSPRGERRLLGELLENRLPLATLSIAAVSVMQDEGNAATTQYDFTVTLADPPAAGDVSVDFQTIDGTATTADGDYIANSGTLVFMQGQTEKTISVLVNGDQKIEADEMFSVELASPQGADLGTATATDVIANDDTASVTISSPVSILEGDAGQQTMTFTVELSDPVDTTVSVDFAAVDGTATVADSDYLAASGTVVFAPNETSKTIQITILSDVDIEGDDSFTVELTNLDAGGREGATVLLAQSTATGTIENDDVTFDATISIDDVTEMEATENYVFTVSLSRPLNVDVSFDATTDLDTTNFVIPAGSTSALVTIFIPDNDIVEFDGEFDVLIENVVAQGATIALGKTMGLGVILDDDTATISIDDVTQLESLEDYVFTISLSNLVDLDIFLDVTTDLDVQTIVIDPLMMQTTVTVHIPDNNIVEFDGFFEVLLSNLDAAGLPVTFLKSVGTGNILDDDTAVLSIDDVALSEGDDGTTQFIYTLALSNPVDADVSIDFQTVDGTATTADGDYAAASGTIVFLPMETAKTIVVTVNGDVIVELDEMFTLELSNLDAEGLEGVAVTLDRAVAEGQILNDDLALISIAAISELEGDAGDKTFVFEVTLSKPVSFPVSVDVATSDGTATTADGDYDAASQTFTFTPGGPLVQTFSVTVHGDLSIEDDEDFLVTLSNLVFPNTPLAVAISPDAGEVAGAILNDDGRVSIDDASAAEGDDGTTLLTFTVSLSEPAAGPTTVDFALVHDTTNADDFEVDPLDPTTGTISFAMGESSKTITVRVHQDVTVELDERFTIVLSNAVLNGQQNLQFADDTGEGFILNDDTAEISIDEVALAEGDAGTTTHVYTVTLSNPVDVPVSIDVATLDGTATTADGDYVANSQTLTFTPGGALTQTFSVTVNGDVKVELDEAYSVVLSNLQMDDPRAVVISALSGTGAGSILNDDVATVSIDDVSIAEGDAGTTVYTFTVTLSNPADVDVSVDVATADGTATVADGDYVANSQTLTFTPGGALTQTFSVTVNGDLKVELDESFFVDLSNLVLGNTRSVSIDDAQGDGIILNDDTAVVSIDSVSHSEGNAGTTSYTYTVTLSNPVDTSVSVLVSTADGTATIANNDYVANSQTITFTPGGALTQTFTVLVNGDVTVEDDETFTVVLSNLTTGDPRDVAISSTENVGTGTIVNDDAVPTISIGDATIVEGNSGTSVLQFTVTLSQASGQEVTVAFAASNGTATIADSDYVANSGTVTFAVGETSKTIQVTINGDAKVEADETINVTLTSPVNATLADAAAIGTITNDDTAILSIANVSQVETNSGTTSFTFTVTLSAAVQGGLTVSFATADGTATIANSDYVANSGTLTFTGTAGETRTITVTVNGDTTVESDETFTVALSNVVLTAGLDAADVTLSGSPATGTIQNDDSTTGTASLAGIVYVDGDNDGVRDTGEPGIPGVTITLTGTTTGGVSVAMSMLTDDNGAYSFTNLAAGTYTITEKHPVAFVDGIDVIGTPGGTVGNDVLSAITLADGIAGANNNFGERGLAPGFASKNLLLASTPSAAIYLRELNARGEELAGNTALAAAIRSSETTPPASSGALAPESALVASETPSESTDETESESSAAPASAAALVADSSSDSGSETSSEMSAAQSAAASVPNSADVIQPLDIGYFASSSPSTTDSQIDETDDEEPAQSSASADSVDLALAEGDSDDDSPLDRLTAVDSDDDEDSDDEAASDEESEADEQQLALAIDQLMNASSWQDNSADDAEPAAKSEAEMQAERQAVDEALADAAA